MSANTLGKLFLIPIPIVEGNLDTIPTAVKDKSISLKYYFVENVRTARRYLKQIDKSINIDSITFSEVNQRNPADTQLLKEWLQHGFEIGIMSESGCPGVADPGSVLVAAAQEMGALVEPMVGPSSILLALMGSGFSGQNFRFGGYLPIKNPDRSNAIKQMEDWSLQRNETQIFIETPYRNLQMIQDLIQHCSGKTKLCVAANISGENALIKTMTLNEWKSQINHLDLQKTPCIFLIYRNM